MIANRFPRPDVVNAAVQSPPARRSLLLILLTVVLARVPADKTPRWAGVPVFGAFLLVTGSTALRLALPWNRVAVDREGLVRQRAVSHPGEIALPYRLSLSAEPLAANLQTILTESRTGVPSAGMS